MDMLIDLVGEKHIAEMILNDATQMETRDKFTKCIGEIKETVKHEQICNLSLVYTNNRVTSYCFTQNNLVVDKLLDY